jgi:nucleoid-associated protein YgaU
LAGTIHTASGDPDSLSAVATAVYGDASKWKVLWKANKGHIAFPELVPKGTPVVVP